MCFVPPAGACHGFSIQLMLPAVASSPLLDGFSQCRSHQIHRRLSASPTRRKHVKTTCHHNRTPAPGPTRTIHRPRVPPAKNDAPMRWELHNLEFAFIWNSHPCRANVENTTDDGLPYPGFTSSCRFRVLKYAQTLTAETSSLHSLFPIVQHEHGCVFWNLRSARLSAPNDCRPKDLGPFWA